MNLRHRLRDIFVKPVAGKQGVHLDPLEMGPLDTREWSKQQHAVWASPEMQTFRDCLRQGNLDIREAVLDDLACYYHISAAEARERCLHWEAWSAQEWSATDRNSPEAVQAFYDSVESWTYDCLWYAYQQAMGYAYPASVVAAQYAISASAKDHLDFGSGVGLTSHLFTRLGIRSTMADVSPTLLTFAQWRMERRGVRVPVINLTKDTLPSNAFDIVTAIDSLFCATDFDQAVANIHRSLKPGGHLLATFDVRAKDLPETAWHLYHSVVDLEHRLQIAGFKRVSTTEFTLPTYQRLELGSPEYATRRQLLQASLPIRRVLEPARRVRWPTPSRVARVLRRLTTPA